MKDGGCHSVEYTYAYHSARPILSLPRRYLLMLSTHSMMQCTSITLPQTPLRCTDAVSSIVQNYKYTYYGDILPHVEKFA